MKTVLISGGAGFIGLSLARAFAADGATVHVLDNLSRGKNDAELAAFHAQPATELIQLDLAAESTTDKLTTDYDAILHFAAIVGVANVMDRPYETLTLNVALTREVLRLARRQKNLRVFVFASTSEVYAGSLSAGLLQFPTREDSVIALAPLTSARTSYMLSKLYGEAMVCQAGVPYIIVRPHNIYGPRMGTEHVVPELMKRMRAGKPGADMRIYSPRHTRTFCYIDDVVELIKRLTKSHQAIGNVWNVGTEAPEYSILEVAEIVRRTLGADVNLVLGDETAGSPVRRCPSMARTNALTGYDQRVSLEDGVGRAWRWYAEHFFSRSAEPTPT
jgi:nucleoside-diphosphate-sugar epimerase